MTLQTRFNAAKVSFIYALQVLLYDLEFLEVIVMPAGLHMLPILGLTSMKWTLLKTLPLYLN